MIRSEGAKMVIRLVATYIGAVIGAGFASGQEILQFFILYGYKGLLGVLVATILFAYLGAKVLELSVRLKCSNYQELLAYLLGPWAGSFMDKLSLFMLIGGLGVMLSGSGAVLQEYMGLPRWIGIGLALVFVIAVIFNGLRGLLAVNVILVPVKLLAVAIIACLALAFKGLPQNLPVLSGQGVGGHWLWASLLYVSFNMVVPLAVLSSMGRAVSKRVGIYAGLLGGLGLGVAVALVTLAGLAFYPEVAHYQVPMLYMASGVSSLLKPVFAILIWLAIMTTAIANAHGFASRLAPEGGRRYRVIGVLACFAVLPLTNIGFADLVKLLYPLFGYAGLLLLAALLVVPLFKSRIY
ncbi:hypothetical protein [Desulforamulus ruminis]|uniref:YkvI family membrane protein n=1 Tax=Desulforamulus ruminis TaxID=1564 RepID=UPI0023562AF9|nr:hypothetical protein [Desulforamulus ruminis]